MAKVGRPITWDHAHIPHKRIAWPPERRDAVARAAAARGISSHALIHRLITAGLFVLGDEDDES